MVQKNPDSNQPDTLFIGRYYLYLPETGSTNIALKALITETSLPEGAVVSTGHQTKGRGQAGTSWEAAREENITLSVLLYPRFLKVLRQFSLSQAMALGIADFLKSYLPGNIVSIKWPNDIYVQSQKICGILIENSLKGDSMESAIIGIGINVNELQTISGRTSLKTITRQTYDLKSLENRLFSFLEARYLQLRSNPQLTAKEYQDNLLGFEKKMQFIDLRNNESFAGTIIGINPDGRLLIETRSGLMLFGMKEVKFVI